MRVRRATADDAEQVAEVFIRSLESLEFLPRLHTDAEHREFVRLLLGRDEVWVAEDAGEILGMAALSGGVLGQLYVDPVHQGCGAGSALLDRVKRSCPGGFTFWVFQKNTRARDFYERRSCRLVRLTDGSGNEERTPDALYEWRPDHATGTDPEHPDRPPGSRRPAPPAGGGSGGLDVRRYRP